MRHHLAAPLLVLTVVACATSATPRPVASSAVAKEATPSAPAPLAVDTPLTTADGNTFLAPAGWTVEVRGQATILEAPERGSRLAIVDVKARDAEGAVAAAWAAYPPGLRWPLKVSTPVAPRDGWEERRSFDYLVPPNEKREVFALAARAGDRWTVVIYDLDQGVGEKRAAAVELVFGRLLPRGYAVESFAGRKAHALDAARLAELRAFVERSMVELKIPGVAYGIIQGGQVVFQGGLGVKQLGVPGAPDADTLFMIGSNTKALTTLMLARLVDQGRIGWDTPVTELLPSFRLGDAETTRQVKVRHLICACTGLPRQDLEWLLEFQDFSCEKALATLGTMQPTSKFGEMFQYSNPMAAAAGFVGGHVLYPALELGRAYDEAMRTQVFEPLGMHDTTFDYGRAERGNHAMPHAPDLDGAVARAAHEVNSAAIPCGRPAPPGAASATCSATWPWSSPRGSSLAVAGTSAAGRSWSGGWRR